MIAGLGDGKHGMVRGIRKIVPAHHDANRSIWYLFAMLVSIQFSCPILPSFPDSKLGHRK